MTIARSNTNIVVTPFLSLHRRLKGLVESYGMSFSDCDAFEDTILKLMGVEEKPRGCLLQESPYLGANQCTLVLTISSESADLFVKQLKRYPALDARIIKYARDLLDIQTQVNGYEGIVISMDAAAVEKHLVPLFETYLKEHPDVVTHYRSFNHKAEDVCFAITQIAKDKRKNVDDLIKSLYAMMLATDVPKSKLMIETLTMFSLSLVNLISSYLSIAQEKDQVVQILGGSLNRNVHTGICTNLTLFYRTPEKLKPHNPIAQMINDRVPDTAVIDSEDCEVKSDTKITVISIKNSALMSKQFHSRCDLALRIFPQERKNEKPIFIEELTRLKQLKKLLAENKDYEKIPRIKKLVKLIEIFINDLALCDHADFKSFDNLSIQLNLECVKITNDMELSLVIKEERLRSETDRSLLFNEIWSEIKSLCASVLRKFQNPHEARNRLVSR